MQSQDDQKPRSEQELPSAEGQIPKAALRLNLVGASTIEIYQNSLFRLDKLWVYFNQYSALLLIVSGVRSLYPMLNTMQGSTASRWILLLVPPIAYVAFATRNHYSMSLALTELRMIRNITVTKTPYKFNEVDRGATLWCHFLLVILVLVLYALVCYSAPSDP